MINEVLIVAINSSHVMLHHHIRVSFFNQPALANPRSNQNNGIEIFYTRRESPLADYLTKSSSPGLKLKRDKILFYCIFDEFLATCVSQTSLNHFSTILCFNYQQHFSSFDLWRHWELVLESVLFEYAENAMWLWIIGWQDWERYLSSGPPASRHPWSWEENI